MRSTNYAFLTPTQIVPYEEITWSSANGTPRSLNDIRLAMIDYLPRYYSDSYVVNNILNVESAEIADFYAEITDVLAQLFVDSATWGLAYWERMLRITVDETKDAGQRRSVIKSKLRGVGTVSAELIQTVASSFENGDVKVTEDNANYAIKVTFISAKGIPPNLADIQAAIRAILPAHLGVTFTFNYLLFSELDALNWTFADLDAQNLTFETLEVYG